MSFKKSIVFAAALMIGMGTAYQSGLAQGVMDNGRPQLKKSAKYNDRNYKFDEKACEVYKKYVERMYRTEQIAINYFTALRNTYARCEFYDPFAEKTIGALLELVEKTRSTDAETVITALNDYKQTIRRHTANLTVINFAIDFAKEDPRLGNLRLLEFIREGIITNLGASGDNGRFPNSAFDVITLGEEDYLLSLQKGEIVNQEMGVLSGDRYYNVYDFQTDMGAREFTIFVDVTVPIKAIQSANQEEEESLDALAGPRGTVQGFK